ncbi:uncharacterized protein TM35_000571240 [Trypanosoma theileri]|uniref:Mucin-associated surface protein (MASP) n=1 Tax=Trypanosoma theileri TaxID=67003 RepID=A0A1X0NGG1_9TRYP|nr:uncharacterized protein TM35_000571240 [Trypanosoma theileri]ORC83796.1 hypothetical protein TM35_000571240 [Trypanosoma theileri]
MTVMMMGRVMCVLAVVLCCACGYTMAAAAGDPVVVKSPVDYSLDKNKPYFPWVPDTSEEVYYCMQNKVEGHKNKKHCASWGKTKMPDEAVAKGIKEPQLLNEQPQHNDRVDDHSAHLADSTTDPGRRSANAELSRTEETSEAGSHSSSEGDAADSPKPALPVAREEAEHPVEVTSVGSHEAEAGVTEEKSSKQKQAKDKELENKQEKTESVRDAVSSSENSASEINSQSGAEGNTKVPGTTTTQNQPLESNAAPQSNHESSNDNDKQTTISDSNVTHQSTSTSGSTATEGSHENANADSTATTNTHTETSNTMNNSSLPVPVPNAEISNIASTVQNKGNADSSSITSVWVRVPLLIVAVLFSVTVY